MSSEFPPEDACRRLHNGRPTSYFKIMGHPEIGAGFIPEHLMHKIQTHYPRVSFKLDMIYVWEPQVAMDSGPEPELGLGLEALSITSRLQAEIEARRKALSSSAGRERTFLVVSTEIDEHLDPDGDPFGSHTNMAERFSWLFRDWGFSISPCECSEYDLEMSRVATPVIVASGATPGRPVPFTDLMGGIIRDIPWRMKFSLDGCHSRALKRVRRDQLKYRFRRLVPGLAKGEAPYSRLLDQDYFSWATVTRRFETWGSDDNQAEERARQISFSLMQMGVSSEDKPQVTEMEHAVKLLPVYRPNSPWSNGQVMFVTTDGKRFPYDPHSHKKCSSIEIIHSQSSQDLDLYRCAVDTGIASRGDALSNLMRVNIGSGRDRLHEQIGKRLRKSERDLVAQYTVSRASKIAINPFDTSLGFQLTDGCENDAHCILMAIMELSDKRYDEHILDSLIHSVISEAYRHFSADVNPKLYAPGVSDEVDAVLVRHGLQAPKLWWQIVNLMFVLGEYTVAMLAQRHAVPVLSDIVMLLRHSGIQEIFGDTTIKSVSDHLESVIKQWPAISTPTTFSVADSKIVTISLDDIRSDGAEGLKNIDQVLYLLARKALVSAFFSESSRCRYRDRSEGRDPHIAYHQKKLDEHANSGALNKISYGSVKDVWHSRAVRKQLIQDAREAKKLDVMITFEEAGDSIPEELEWLTTSHAILNPEKHSFEKICKIVGQEESVPCGYYRRVGKGLNLIFTCRLMSHHRRVCQHLVLDPLLHLD
ncbi:hypothetical protein [Pseudomonas putida]|uniref:Uncharacterized protein n=1 Tax=Pseudomonas putida TaxID=303 RepID=A0A8I1JIJ5_PSEPU|nr:hypothetical protein [Pseudomonas putida]MBI6885067.1 hypothetical protein [Pseudomonas putida]